MGEDDKFLVFFILAFHAVLPNTKNKHRLIGKGLTESGRYVILYTAIHTVAERTRI